MNYMKMVPCDIANGPGVRVSLFVTGCNHHCPSCHNPQTWDPDAGQPFTEKTLDELIELLRPDYIQGLTLTGGDPLYSENRQMICKILIRVRKEFGDKKDVWMWTGYTLEEIWHQDDYLTVGSWLHWVLSIVDVVVDGPYIESKRDISLPYMGSSNQRVIDVYESTKNGKPTLWWTPENNKGE